MNRGNMVTLGVLVAVLLCAGTFTYFYLNQLRDTDDSDAQRVLSSSEDQVFTDLEGKHSTLDSFERKIRVVNSWASWSPFSVEELALLDQIAQQYASQDVVVIAINRKEAKEQAQRFLDTLQDFEHVHFIIDANDTYFGSIGGYAMPETVIFDQEGTIVFHKRGALSLEELTSELDALLVSQQQ